MRCARQLIEHACRAAGVGPAVIETEDTASESAIEAITPPALEGLAEELGLAEPTRQSKRSRKTNA